MNRLKQLRESKELLQSDVANFLGISTSGYGFYETGKRTMPSNKAKKLAEFFNVSMDYLLGNDDAITDMETIPILGDISAGTPIIANENIVGEFSVPTSIISGNKEDYFFLRVVGDSMNCLFNDGDLVLIRKDTIIENGDVCAVRIEDDVTIKKVQVHDAMIVLEPCSTNPEHIAHVYNAREVNIDIIGKATYYIGKL